MTDLNIYRKIDWENASDEEILEQVQDFISKGAEDKYFKNTALVLAASYGRTETVQLLIENGANVNAREIDGKTALMMAASHGHTETAKLLIENGADINTKDEDGNTTLMWAAEENTETVQLLIENGANVNARNKNGKTALMWAIYYGHTETADILKTAMDKSNSETTRTQKRAKSKKNQLLHEKNVKER